MCKWRNIRIVLKIKHKCWAPWAEITFEQKNKPNIDRVTENSTVKQFLYQIIASKQRLFSFHAKRKCQSHLCDQMECIPNKHKIQYPQLKAGQTTK